MRQIAYERPREKIRNRGVESLTTTELFQIVIGSGSATKSGAVLAREIEQISLEGALHFDTLTRIRGIGEAKACQLLAALELGKRLNTG